MVAAAAVCILWVGAAGARQSQPAPPRPQFRSTVDTVHLDVSVLDRNRRPVRGLTPADFTILEDGQPQQIAVFQAVDIPDPEPPTAPWRREVALDVATNDGLQDRRLFLIIMDDATIQGDVRAIAKAREIAHRVIDRLGPSDLAAVIFTYNNRHAQDYTADLTRLRTAVDTFMPGARDLGLFDAETRKPIKGQDDYFFLSSVGVLERAVDVLGGLPDRRKAIVYVGQGLPVDLTLLAPQPAGLSAGGGSSPTMQGLMASQVTGQMKNVFLKATRANVNVYTIDPCGLRAPSFQEFPPPTCVPGLEIDYLRAIAAGTGGRAVVDTNDFEPGVAAIFRENSSYYLLGYRPSGPGQDGKFHRLEVRVNRPGVEVRTRNGYQAEKASEARKRIAAAAATPLGVAVAGILPKSDLSMQMSAVPLPLPGRKDSAVAIVIGVRQPVRETSSRVVERVDLQVSAFDVNGKQLASRRAQADVTLRAGATGLAEYEVVSRLDLDPGRYQLRVAGSVGSLSTSGSLYHDIDVPDLSKVPVMFSGFFFSATPGPVVAPRDFLQPIVPVVPTTRRTFTEKHRVTAFARLYQGKKTPLVPMTVRVLLTDQFGKTAMETWEDVGRDRFTAGRSADIQVDLPVDRVAGGEYLLALEAKLGGVTARRETRFAVER